METVTMDVAAKPRRRTGFRVTIIALIVLGLGAAAFFLLRGRLSPGTAAAQASTAEDPGYTVVRAERGDILVTVPASGKLEPSRSQTVRPDPNMPTRAITRILVTEGNRVTAGTPLLAVDTSGLDLELESAQATYDSQRIKLDNLKAGPTQQELATAELDLRQAEVALNQAREDLDSTRALVDKGLVSRDQLTGAQRQADLAQLKYDAQKVKYDDVKDGPSEDAIRTQEAAVAQAANNYQKARLVYASTVVRSPGAGTIADIAVNVGDLAGASTGLMTLAVMDPMILTAMVDETDVKNVKVGQPVTVTLGSDANVTLPGKVTNVAVRAQTQSNVTVFAATIEVPNPGGALLWGMNADAEVVVAEARDTLLLPLAAVTRTENTATVNIVEEGKLIAWEVRAGTDDGSRIQILRGLDEGDEVAVPRRTTGATTRQQADSAQSGFGAGAMFRVFR